MASIHPAALGKSSDEKVGDNGSVGFFLKMRGKLRERLLQYRRRPRPTNPQSSLQSSTGNSDKTERVSTSDLPPVPSTPRNVSILPGAASHLKKTSDHNGSKLASRPTSRQAKHSDLPHRMESGNSDSHRPLMTEKPREILEQEKSAPSSSHESVGAPGQTLTGDLETGPPPTPAGRLKTSLIEAAEEPAPSLAAFEFEGEGPIFEPMDMLAQISNSRFSNADTVVDEVLEMVKDVDLQPSPASSANAPTVAQPNDAKLPKYSRASQQPVQGSPILPVGKVQRPPRLSTYMGSTPNGQRNHSVSHSSTAASPMTTATTPTESPTPYTPTYHHQEVHPALRDSWSPHSPFVNDGMSPGHPQATTPEPIFDDPALREAAKNYQLFMAATDHTARLSVSKGHQRQYYHGYDYEPLAARDSISTVMEGKPPHRRSYGSPPSMGRPRTSGRTSRRVTAYEMGCMPDNHSSSMYYYRGEDTYSMRSNPRGPGAHHPNKGAPTSGSGKLRRSSTFNGRNSPRAVNGFVPPPNHETGYQQLNYNY